VLIFAGCCGAPITFEDALRQTRYENLKKSSIEDALKALDSTDVDESCLAMRVLGEGEVTPEIASAFIRTLMRWENYWIESPALKNSSEGRERLKAIESNCMRYIIRSDTLPTAEFIVAFITESPDKREHLIKYLSIDSTFQPHLSSYDVVHNVLREWIKSNNTDVVEHTAWVLKSYNDIADLKLLLMAQDKWRKASNSNPNGSPLRSINRVVLYFKKLSTQSYNPPSDK
jgi:hypothetical protein